MLAIVTHLTIILYLSPLGADDNHVVIPWNITLITLVTALFWKKDNSLHFWKNSSRPMLALNLLAVLLFGLLPAFNLAGAWDDFLSFSLYSDKAKRYYIAVEQGEVYKLGPTLRPYFVAIAGMQGGEMIDINEWAMEELKVPFYPERAALRKLSKPFCRLGIEDEKLLFIEYLQPVSANRFWTTTCSGMKE
ncbi:MAG: hypothetical protein R3B47_16705 [Bacteroidia bacterium]